MAFTSGCQKDATNEKNTQKIEKNKNSYAEKRYYDADWWKT